MRCQPVFYRGSLSLDNNFSVDIVPAQPGSVAIGSNDMGSNNINSTCLHCEETPERLEHTK